MEKDTCSSEDGRPEYHTSPLGMARAEVRELRAALKDLVAEADQAKADIAELNERLHERTQGFLRRAAVDRREIGRLEEQKREWQEARMVGRREAFEILCRMNPQDLDDFINTRAVADTGEYDSYWDADKLAELLDAKTPIGMLERLEEGYCEICAANYGLEERMRQSEVGRAVAEGIMPFLLFQPTAEQQASFWEGMWVKQTAERRAEIIEAWKIIDRLHSERQKPQFYSRGACPRALAWLAAQDWAAKAAMDEAGKAVAE